MKKIISLFLKSLMVVLAFSTLTACQTKQNRFEVGDGTFLLNGEPFLVKAAELHYPRIPAAYWEHRIEMCKALGMNTICIYVFWNIHEQQEGVYNFTGNNDIRAFCQLAQKHGMYVIVRPGPYVCAEWEMGGLPWWLLKKQDIRLRELDPYFIERVRLFEKEVGKQLADMQISRGGNIIMVQVENEYGSYGEDKAYVAAVRDAVREAGFTDVPLFQCDWASNFELNALDDLVWTMNFGTSTDVDSQFRRLKELRPHSPLMCSEFWSGWFDNWGRQHETRDATAMVAGLTEMLEKNVSFSLYMTQGGTSFGQWAGANSPGFWPDCSSYDYNAPINEAGQATDKYHKLREMMAEHNNGKPLPQIPQAIPMQTVEAFSLTHISPLFEELPEAHRSEDVKTMEQLNQGWGSVLYRTTLTANDDLSEVRISDVHDYARVYIDSEYIGTLDRRNAENTLTLPATTEGAILDIFVEAMGRINFGRAIKDFKGITHRVERIYTDAQDTILHELKNWEMYSFPVDYSFAKNRTYHPIEGDLKPGYYKGHFFVDKKADTFLDLSQWGKGLVWVNGHCLGRFWEIGPQQTLYLPGCWLKKGKNEIIILDIKGAKENTVCGHTESILDVLQDPVATHRAYGEGKLDLTSEAKVYSSAFQWGNGWQQQAFPAIAEGQYLCIEILSNHAQESDQSAIAEWYLLDEKGERISREPWKIQYADSEDTEQNSHKADRIYDLQESTYWCSEKGDELPYHIVIDLGHKHQIIAIQYLPRMEEGAPGCIQNFSIYLSDKPYKLVK